tara:strand:- start:10270 stop:12228 length:1959 start_codon:yes stop_codon:yes gene_type:complete
VLNAKTAGLMGIASQQITPNPMGSRSGVDILSIQDDLKNLSDQQLSVAMQSGTPTYLVASEKNRRVNMRKDFEARKSAQEGTVVQDLFSNQQPLAMGRMQQSVLPRPQGIQSLPGSPEQPVMQMQEGGLVFDPYIRERIKREEDFRSEIYPDNKSPAIAYGYNLTPEEIEQGYVVTPQGNININNPINEEEASRLLDMRGMENLQAGVNLLDQKGIDYNALPSGIQKSIQDNVYRGGAGILSSSPNFIEALSKNDYKTAIDEIGTIGTGYTVDGEFQTQPGLVERSLGNQEIARYGMTLDDLTSQSNNPMIPSYLNKLNLLQRQIDFAEKNYAQDVAGETTPLQRDPGFNIAQRIRNRFAGYEPTTPEEIETLKNEYAKISSDLSTLLGTQEFREAKRKLTDQKITPDEYEREVAKLSNKFLGANMGGDGQPNNQTVTNQVEEDINKDQGDPPPRPVVEETTVSPALVSDTDKESARKLAFLEAALRVASSDSPTILGALGEAVPAIEGYRDELSAIEQRKLNRATAEFYGSGDKNLPQIQARAQASTKAFVEQFGALATGDTVVGALRTLLRPDATDQQNIVQNNLLNKMIRDIGNVNTGEKITDSQNIKAIITAQMPIYYRTAFGGGLPTQLGLNPSGQKGTVEGLLKNP